MEYQHDIYGLDVLQSGEDGPSGQQGLHHHVKPVGSQKHKKVHEALILIWKSMYEYVGLNLLKSVLMGHIFVVTRKRDKY
jgi:hypothetical protein